MKLMECTIKQILKAPQPNVSENLFIDGVEVKLLHLCARVIQEKNNDRQIAYELNDHSGTISAILYHQNDETDHIAKYVGF